ncbi:MAG: low molecular weight protein-tyrosine-phosphatase [Bacteroidales bacterium]|nr:low molecular weight protein-tyrosine-phosphatase [Bacteroidales bacterium]
MKILMVCLGNICRSPMAEGIMQAKIEKYKLDVEVDSAGFEAFHTGDAPDFRAVRVMKQHGIDISGQRSRLFRISDFDVFDRIYVMDSGNFSDVKSMAKDVNHMQKVDYILNISHQGSNKPVPDPYYGGEQGFEKTYQLLDSATELIAIEIKNGGK